MASHDWRDEYLASIKEAEKNSPVNGDLVAACSHLQDRVAALEAERDVLLASAAASPGPGTTTPGKASPGKAAAQDVVEGSAPAAAKLRADLAESLAAQGRLQTRLKTAEQELERLRVRTAEDARAIRQLTSERNSLATKVRDRDEELRGKSKLVENVQDELIALTLQLNVTEQRKAKIETENKELVERWMQRMGHEADAMNRANEPIFKKRH